MSAEIIFYEAADYAGKGTQIEMARQYLEELGKKVKVLIEPGCTETMTKVREILLSKEVDDKDKLSYLTRRLLYAADYAQLMDRLESIKDDYDYILVDRNVLVSDFIFGPMSLPIEQQLAGLTIFKKILRVHRIFASINGFTALRNSKIVFIQLNNETLRGRATQRDSQNQDAEKILFDAWNIDRKIQINESYNEFISDLEEYRYGDINILSNMKNCIVVNGNQSVQDVFREMIDKGVVGNGD